MRRSAHPPGPSRGSAAALVLAALALVVPAAARQARPPVVDLTPEGVAAAGSKYVAEYQKAFSYLIADEVYLQAVDREELPTEHRRLEGELFMTYLPADDEWITVHDVAKVDNRPVADRENLRQLLQAGTDRGVVDRIANRNAAFNIGSVIRNFNEPTLPLLILSEKRRPQSKFRRTRMTTEGDVTLVTLAFEEQRRPTLISSATGGAVFSKGSFLLEAGTGRVRETTLELEDGRVKAWMSTTYTYEPRLELWVPSVFRERYERRHRGTGLEVVTGEATYTNYRRFTATGRIGRSGGGRGGR